MTGLERHRLAPLDFREIFMPREERRHLFPILLRLVGAGGVDEPSARRHMSRCRVEDLRLESRQLIQVVHAPAPARVRPPTQHARV